MIKFHCPHCEQKLGVPDEYAGKRVRCSKCKQAAVVPQPELEFESVHAEVEPEYALEEQPPQEDYAQDEMAALRGIKAPPPNIPKSKKDRSAAGVGDLAKGMGRIPLSIGISVLLMAVCIIVWVGVAKMTGLILGFLVLAVPLSGAWGLVCLTDRRSVGLGLLAILVGFIGMISGKVVMAKWVVYPMIQEELENDDSEVSRGFREGFGDLADAVQLDPEDVQYYIEDEEDTMVYIAAIDFVHEGRWDMQTVKDMYMLDDMISDEEVPIHIQDGFMDSYDRLDSWSENQKVSRLKEYYNEYNQMISECFSEALMDSDFGKGIMGIGAFFGSCVLLDLIWFPMGLVGAYKIGAGKD